MTEVSEENAAPQPLQISHVLGTFLQQMPIPIDIAGHASCFQLVPYKEDDGTDSVAVALATSKGNDISIIWFREPEMRQFVNNAMQAHQAMLKELKAKNPLLVASENDMRQAIARKNFVDGKLVLGGK
jgi:hypothetical protein